MIAEDGDSVILRVRETLGCSNNGRLMLDNCLDPSTLCETDMLEENGRDPSFGFHPFEIRTYEVGRLR